MPTISPNYYGIIPANVRYNKELTFLEKFLFCELTALSNVDGYCSARNEYFAELYTKDKATISRAFNHLEELGIVKIEYDKQGAKVNKRRIYPLTIKTTNDKIVNGTETTNDKNITREQEKLLLTIDKIVKENNTSYNNILNIILDNIKKENKEKKINEMIENSTLTEKQKELINEWLKYKKQKRQGYVEEGFKKFLNDFIEYTKQYSDEIIETSMHNCMSNNYAGLFIKAQTLPNKDQKKSINNMTVKETGLSFSEIMRRL